MTILLYLAGLGLSAYTFLGGTFLTENGKVFAILYMLIITGFLLTKHPRGRK